MIMNKSKLPQTLGTLQPLTLSCTLYTEFHSLLAALAKLESLYSPLIHANLNIHSLAIPQGKWLFGNLNKKHPLCTNYVLVTTYYPHKQILITAAADLNQILFMPCWTGQLENPHHAGLLYRRTIGAPGFVWLGEGLPEEQLLPIDHVLPSNPVSISSKPFSLALLLARSRRLMMFCDMLD